MQQRFPTNWKYSKVVPLHKKDSKLERQNYRPVTLLSPLSKILEKVLYEQVYDHFTKNRIFHENLHGFRKNRSTQSALMTMYDRWIQSASLGKLSGVVLIDLSAAFDLVDHILLIKKLRICGLQEDFLISYLLILVADIKLSGSTILSRNFCTVELEYPKEASSVHCFFLCISTICQTH